MSEAAVADLPAEITSLGDKIADLTLKQAKQLSDYIENKYGIKPAAGGAVMMAPDGGGEGQPRRGGFLRIAVGRKHAQVIRCPGSGCECHDRFRKPARQHRPSGGQAEAGIIGPSHQHSSVANPARQC